MKVHINSIKVHCLTEEDLGDRVAAIVNALYHLKDRSRKRIQRKRNAKTHEFKRLQNGYLMGVDRQPFFA